MKGDVSKFKILAHHLIFRPDEEDAVRQHPPYSTGSPINTRPLLGSVNYLLDLSAGYLYTDSTGFRILNFYSLKVEIANVEVC